MDVINDDRNSLHWVFIKLVKSIDWTKPSSKEWMIQSQFCLRLCSNDGRLDNCNVEWVWWSVLGDKGLEAACISWTGILDFSTDLETRRHECMRIYAQEIYLRADTSKLITFVRIINHRLQAWYHLNQLAICSNSESLWFLWTTKWMKVISITSGWQTYMLLKYSSWASLPRSSSSMSPFLLASSSWTRRTILKTLSGSHQRSWQRAMVHAAER